MREENIKVKLSIEANNLKCSVQSAIIKDNLLYAFYLKKEAERVAMKWYSDACTVEFQINISGIYTVVCFILDDGEKTIIETDAVFVNVDIPKEKNCVASVIEKEKIAISIFGSCVTRDLLEFDKKAVFELKNYFARQAIVSSVSKPLNCKLEDINLSSNFQRKQVFNDLTKNAFEILKNDGSKWLMIDLIDERFSLIQYQNSFVTNSPYMVESGYIECPQIVHYKENDRGGYTVFDIQLEKYVQKFCEKILDIYDAEHIVIHKAYMLDYYLNKNNQVEKFPKVELLKNQNINKRLDYMYACLIKNLKNAHVIDLCRNTIATENHKWGLAPMHYCEDYYKAVLEKLYEICTDRR